MDIKDLDRSQFLLLLLLIVLVTSITTAVVTVTLLDQTPKASIANTVNRVIERVVPGATTTVVKIVKETPTVSEGEQVVKAIEPISSAVIKLMQRTEKGNEYLGTGFIVRDGLAVTALKNLPSELKSSSLLVVKNTSASSSADTLVRDTDNNVAFIKFAATSTLPAGKFGYGTNLPTNGQTGVALSYSESGNPDIMIGLVMGIIPASVSTSTDQKVDIIRIGSVIGDNIGGPVIGLDGRLIGIGISRGYALSASALKSLIDHIK